MASTKTNLNLNNCSSINLPFREVWQCVKLRRKNKEQERKKRLHSGVRVMELNLESGLI